MSGGRVELGLGAGWFEEEHRAYGIPFPEGEVRAAGGAAGDRHRPVGHGGRQDLRLRRARTTSCTDSPALPKPAQAKVPVLIGGHGATRTPRLAARYADEFNMPFASIEDSERQFGRVRAAAEEAGRSGRRPGVLQRPGRLRRQGRRRGRPPGRRHRPRGGRAEGQRPGGLPGRGRRQDRPLRGDRCVPDLPPDPRPRRPGPPGADLRPRSSPSWADRPRTRSTVEPVRTLSAALAVRDRRPRRRPVQPAGGAGLRSVRRAVVGAAARRRSGADRGAHAAYVRAGAQVLITASYQATFEGFAQRGHRPRRGGTALLGPQRGAGARRGARHGDRRPGVGGRLGRARTGRCSPTAASTGAGTG